MTSESLPVLKVISKKNAKRLCLESMSQESQEGDLYEGKGALKRRADSTCI